MVGGVGRGVVARGTTAHGIMIVMEVFASCHG